MQSTLSKSDKKKYNAVTGNALDIKGEYVTYQLTSKLRVIRNESKFLFFEYFGKVYPTIHNFNRERYKTVYLDDGAALPLSRGADVMAPGILKYQERASKFKKDDIVGIEVGDRGIFAVGLCLIGFDEMVFKGEGPVIDVFHVHGDCLHKMRF